MHERISPNSLCFPDASLADMACHWRDLGTRRISMIAGLVDDPIAVKDLIDVGDYALETITTSFSLDGTLMTEDQKKIMGQNAGLHKLIETAAALGARSIYMTTGGHGEGTWEDAAWRYSKAIAPFVAQATAAGVQLLIETTTPLHADIHLAHSLRDTVELAEIAGLGVCIDIFACWSEAGLKQTVERAMPHCHLIQVSDYVLGDRSLPARAVPGDGVIPLNRIIDWALSAGYRGGFDLELIGPRIMGEGPLDATRRGGDYLGKLLHSLGA